MNIKHQLRNIFNERKEIDPIVLDINEERAEMYLLDIITRRNALLEGRQERWKQWQAKGSKANAIKWELWRKEQYAMFKKRRRIKRTKPRDNDRFTDHGHVRRQWKREHSNE